MLQEHIEELQEQHRAELARSRSAAQNDRERAAEAEAAAKARRLEAELQVWPFCCLTLSHNIPLHMSWVV